MSEELLNELLKVDLFKDLHPKHLKKVAESVELREAKEGDSVVSEGRYSGDFFVILSGDASVTVRGKRRATVGPGDFFGELSILGHTPSATVTASVPMRLGVIDGKEFRSLLDSEPTIAIHLLHALILRLEELTVRPVGELQ